MSKRVLVTGGSGFLGANLTRRLLHEGHEVHLVLRPGHKAWRIKDLLSDVRVHTRDFAEAPVGRIRPDWIFHLAAYGAYPAQTETALILQTNVLGTAILLDACVRQGFEAFVNAGSSSEYGPKDHAPSEDEPLDPIHAYGVGKAAGTLYGRQLAQRTSLRISTLRLYSVYGPWEEPTRLMPTLLNCARAGKWPPLASPESAHDFVYVDDVVEAFLLAASEPNQKPGAVYNIGTGVQTSLGELVELVRRLLPVPVEPQWGTMPGRPWDTNVWVADPAEARRCLGWKPRRTIESGLRETIDWLSWQRA